MASEEIKLTRVGRLEADLAGTRLRLSEDVSALRSKLTPAGLAEEAQAHFQSSQNPAIHALGQRRSAWRAVSSRSPLLTLLGAGLAWTLLRSRHHLEEVD